jgi:peptidoglycan/xylan/chitin deacetylase (PgdA/CDA1 family)
VRGRAIALLTAAPLAMPLSGCSHQGSSAQQHAAAALGAGRAGVASANARTAAQARREAAELRSLIALGKPIYCAAPRGNEVALTFDDGPGVYTRLVLAKLRKHGIHATFFVVGRNIPLLPGALREERALGAVGDHTFTHPLLTALSPHEVEQQIAVTQTAVASASGGPVLLFRPPYGGRNANVDAIARAHGMLEIMWTVDSADSLGANYAQIERNVIGGLRGGAIILMHENHGQTVRALLGIFAALERKHLSTVSVPQLLADAPPSAAQVRAGGSACGLKAGTLGGS